MAYVTRGLRNEVIRMSNTLIDVIQKTERGDADAVFDVVKFLLWNGANEDLDQDFVYYAIAYYQKQAMAGNSDAMLELGTVYLEGRGVPVDRELARAWYQKGIDAGNIRAYRLMGHFYYYDRDKSGRPIKNENEKRRQMGAEVFMKGAELGEPTSLYETGCMYLEGDPVEQDYDKAFEYFTKGLEATKNNKKHPAVPFLNYMVGHCYHHGYGVEKNLTKAKEYLEIASHEGERRTDSGKIADKERSEKAFKELLEIMAESE